MKTAGIVLSIIGVVFTGICLLLYLSGAIAMGSSDFLPDSAASFDVRIILTSIIWVFALILVTCTVLGIAGAAKARTKGMTAGILLVIAAVLCAVTIYGFLAAVFYLLAGIFAFVSDKHSLIPAPATFNYQEDDDETEEFDMGI